MSTGGRGGWVQSGIEFGVLGSNMETWKMGWIACMESGRQRVQDRGPAWLMISY